MHSASGIIQGSGRKPQLSKGFLNYCDLTDSIQQGCFVMLDCATWGLDECEGGQGERCVRLRSARCQQCLGYVCASMTVSLFIGALSSWSGALDMVGGHPPSRYGHRSTSAFCFCRGTVGVC